MPDENWLKLSDTTESMVSLPDINAFSTAPTESSRQDMWCVTICIQAGVYRLDYVSLREALSDIDKIQKEVVG